MASKKLFAVRINVASLAMNLAAALLRSVGGIIKNPCNSLTGETAAFEIDGKNLTRLQAPREQSVPVRPDKRRKG